MSDVEKGRFSLVSESEKNARSTLYFNVSYTVNKSKNEKKYILQDVEEVVRTGETLAIMGPSGAGKTTLLKVLPLDAFGGTATGTVTLNGKPMTDKIFKERCGLVSQEDYHWAFLTCRETISYAASLLLSAPKEEREREVDKLIKEMGLEICQDTYVGNAFMQGLSGGQKRRLSVAITVLKRLEIIYLDEPTSGLDAASASGIMNFLSEVTKTNNLLTIFTIHQPSTAIYNNFNRVLLLSRGRVAYSGVADNVVSYLQLINHPLPPLTNPAEFMLDLVNADFVDEASVLELLDLWQKNKPEVRGHHGLMVPMTHDKVSIMQQVGAMFSRHILITIRDPGLYTGRIIAFLMTCCFFAVIYVKAWHRMQSQIIPRMWFLLWISGVPANMGVGTVFMANIEYKAIRREVVNGMVKPFSYLLANSIIQVPFMFLFGLAVLGVPAYCIMVYKPDHFPQIWLIYSLTMYAWESVAQLLAVCFNNPLLGMLQYIQLWFASFLFCGIFLAINDITWPFRIFSYVLPYQWAFRSMMYQEFIDQTFSGASPCNPETDTDCNVALGRTGPNDGWTCGNGVGLCVTALNPMYILIYAFPFDSNQRPVDATGSMDGKCLRALSRHLLYLIPRTTSATTWALLSLLR